MRSGHTILIIGGSGSLGNQLIQTYLENNHVINYSRDENKHWSMELKYQSPRLLNVIGDIRDATKIRQTLLRHKPTIVIIAAALKHIDRCEYEINESINTNIVGIQNVLDTIEANLDQLLPRLEAVCFVSTDKACSPVNIYGMCKSVCEGLMVEKARFIPRVKFVCVRYGNVLNSRGSIIPILENKCMNPEVTELSLTSVSMTRFIMTLEEAVKLIEHAIVSGQSGEIVIPKLRAMRIQDLFELFSAKYTKPIRIVGLRAGEKINESLINETQSLRTHESNEYYHIRPSFRTTIMQNKESAAFHYHSGVDTVSKSELLGYLTSVGLFATSDTPIHPATRLKQSILPTVYQQRVPFPYGAVDQILPPDLAYCAQKEIFELPDDSWDRYDNPFEQKWTLRDKSNLPPNVQEVFDYLTSSEMVEALSDICGTKLYNDPHKHYWGVHKYDDSDYLQIHVDAGLHPKTRTKKHLTFGIYLSRCWHEGNGCELEIWSGDGAERDDARLNEKMDAITPMFNRAILFTNTDNSWHGNPIRSHGSPGAARVFLTLSYLSDNQDEFDNKRSRAFFRPLPSADPEEAEKLRELSLARASEDGYQSVYRTNEKM